MRRTSLRVATARGDAPAGVDDAARADERDVVGVPVAPDLGPPADPCRLVDDGAHDAGTWPDADVVEEDGVDDLGAGCHLDARSEDAAPHAALDDGAGGEERVLDPALGVHARPDVAQGAGADGPGGVVEVEGRALEELHVGPPVRLDGADVLPVPRVPELGRATSLDERRQDVVAEVTEAVLALPVLAGRPLELAEQRVGGEGEDLRGDDVGGRVVRLELVAFDAPLEATTTP